MDLYIALALLFTVAFVLFMYNIRHRPNAVYMSLSMVLVVLMIGTIDQFNREGSVFWLAIFYNHFTPFYLLIGPLLFFYVRGTLLDDHRLRRNDIWHFLPFFLQLVAILPYLFQPWSFKLRVAGLIAHDYRDVARMPNLQIFPPVWLRTSMRTLSWLAYATFCFIWVYRFRRNYPGRNRIPYRKAFPVLRFMQYFLAVHLLMSVLFAIFFLRFIMDVYGNGSPFMSMPLRTTFAVCMSVIPVMLLFSPEVLYGIPRMNIRDASASQAVPFSPETDPTAGELMEPHPNPMSPGVPEVPDRFNPLAERILSVIAEQKLYLDPDFSLDDLSRTMGVPKHHLYYCFKVIHRTYFTRLRAEFRVRHAQSMLREGYAREVTLDAIGLASGFSSATAFRKAFREIAGMSPRDFQRSIEQTGNS
jgi:AraC-like DNA-binding protein